jgi:hypothetical protein
VHTLDASAECQAMVGNSRSVLLPSRAGGMTFRACLFRSRIVFVAG